MKRQEGADGDRGQGCEARGSHRVAGEVEREDLPRVPSELKSQTLGPQPCHPDAWILEEHAPGISKSVPVQVELISYPSTSYMRPRAFWGHSGLPKGASSRLQGTDTGPSRSALCTGQGRLPDCPQDLGDAPGHSHGSQPPGLEGPQGWNRPLLPSQRLSQTRSLPPDTSQPHSLREGGGKGGGGGVPALAG